MIPGTSVGISQLISAALFVICAMIAVVEETMAKKRAARRRRRREQDYEAQERAAREAEAEEYRDRLRLERAFADGDAAGVPEVYNGTASAYEHDSEDSRIRKPDVLEYKKFHLLSPGFPSLQMSLRWNAQQIKGAALQICCWYTHRKIPC